MIILLIVLRSESRFLQMEVWYKLINNRNIAPWRVETVSLEMKGPEERREVKRFCLIVVII